MSAPRLYLSLFGKPAYRFDNRSTTDTALPFNKPFMLLALLAANDGSLSRAAVEAVWEEMAGVSFEGFPIAHPGNAVRNAESQLRIALRKLCGVPQSDTGTDHSYLCQTGDATLCLHPENVYSDVQDFLRHVGNARAALAAPDKWHDYRAALLVAKALFDAGELATGYDTRWSFVKSTDAKTGAEKRDSWLFAARNRLRTDYTWITERLTDGDRSPWGDLPMYTDVCVWRERLASPVMDFLRGVGKYGTLPALQLWGAGGAGKTRLASDCVRSLGETEAAGRFRGGVTYLALDGDFGIEGADTVAVAGVHSALAAALNAPDPVRKSLPESGDLARWIVSGAHRLLILDNYESVYNAPVNDWLVRFFAQAQGRLRCLVTTRALLTGMPHVAVDGMALPETALADSEAHDLFVERARQETADYTVPDVNALRRLLAQVDGLPLYIEMLAANLHDKNAARLREAADAIAGEPLALLQIPDPPGTASPRHGSASACLAWSIRQLPPNEQTRFVRLGVFPYDWSKDAAEAVCNVPEPMLKAWRKRSLLVQDRTTERWRLLPVLREFAADWLHTDSTDFPRTHTAILDYYVAFISKLPILVNPESIATVQPEKPNIEPVLRRAMNGTITEQEQAIAALKRLPNYAINNGIVSKTLMAQGVAVATTHEWYDMAACLQMCVGTIEKERSEYSSALESMQTALSLAEKGTIFRTRASALYCIGNALVSQNKNTEAITYLKHAETIFRVEGNRHDVALCQSKIGELLYFLDHYEDALIATRDAVAIFDDPAYPESNDAISAASGYRLISAIETLFGNYTTSLHGLRFALRLYKRHNTSLGIANCYDDIGIIHLRRGRVALARSYFDRALALYRSESRLIGTGITQQHLGECDLREGNITTAVSHFQSSLSLFIKINHLASQANALHGLAQAALHRGESNIARSYLGEALDRFRADEDELGAQSTAILSGLAAYKDGDYALAASLLSAPLQWFVEKKQRYETALTHYYLSFCSDRSDWHKSEADRLWRGMLRDTYRETLIQSTTLRIL